MSDCECTESNRTVWIDCTLGYTYPMPARFTSTFKDHKDHWTLSFFNRAEQRLKEVYVKGVICGECFLELS